MSIHDTLVLDCLFMNKYVMWGDDVNIDTSDRGAVIAIIISLLLKSNLEKFKLKKSDFEKCFLLLNAKCYEETGENIFHWKLIDGKLCNFEKFIDFMVQKGLIFYKVKDDVYDVTLEIVPGLSQG